MDKAFAKLRLRVEEKPHPSSHPPIFSSCVGEGVIFAPFVLKLRFQKKVFINKHDNTLLCIVWYVRLQEELNLCTVWLLFVVTSNYSQDQWSHKFHHMYYPNRWLIWKEYNMSPKSVCVLSRYMVPHGVGGWPGCTLGYISSHPHHWRTHFHPPTMPDSVSGKSW